MLKLADGIVELYRKVSSSLPPDVEIALKAAYEKETDERSRDALGVIIENIAAGRKSSLPLCQDTGVPIFFVHVPAGINQREVKEAILEATRSATAKVPLRANAVEVLSGRNSGDNTGEGFPVIYLEETEGDTLTVDLMLKGSGSENIGQTYKLPDESINARRNPDGIRRCIIDAVFRAQGRACPPYTIGAGVGATKDQVAVLSKRQLFRKMTDTNDIAELDTLEKEILRDLNELSIGPLGFGGKTTALGVKIGLNHRHPASYMVDVSISCWANRRGTLLW